MVNTGRRERNRAARHSHLVSAAGAIVAENGLDGLTMGAVAKRVGCAVGTIYTYFSSKSALLASLQFEAIRVLAESYERAASQWDDALDTMDMEEPTAALARMIAMSRLFVSWQHIQPLEFDFLQMLSMSPDQQLEPKDSAAVVPMVLALFAEGRVLHDRAVEVGAICQDLDRPGDDSTSRTVRWVAALEGAILVDNATSGVTGDLDPEAFSQDFITHRLTADFLTAWGAPERVLEAAFEVTELMAKNGTLLPEVI
jgi:AcrR family transcriptional regulator